MQAFEAKGKGGNRVLGKGKERRKKHKETEEGKRAGGVGQLWEEVEKKRKRGRDGSGLGPV